MRNLAQAVLDELAKDDIRAAILAELDFVSGIQRYWTGPEGHDLSWDGKTWTALSDLGQIDKIAESQGLTDARTTISLRVNSANVDRIEADDSRGRSIKLIVLLFAIDGTVIGPIETVGKMGGMTVRAVVREQDGDRVIDELIELDMLFETSILARSQFLRLTNAAQLRIDSTDNGLEFVADPDISNIGPVSDARDSVGRGSGGGTSDEGILRAGFRG